METIITYGIVYLLVFRLAVLLLGGLCIFWGYRLFLVSRQQAGSSTDTADQASELHGKLGSSELTIKSTAPGIFFAAFGAVIVIAVLAGSQPDVKYDEQQTSPQAGTTGQQSETNVQQRSITMRDMPPASTVTQDAGSALYYRSTAKVTPPIRGIGFKLKLDSFANTKTAS